MLEGLLLGLAAGGYCAGACFPVAVPTLFAASPRGLGESARLAGGFLLGRLAVYLVFGFAAGAAGGALPESWSGPGSHAAAWAYLLLGVWMLALGAGLQFPHLDWCRRLRGLLRPGAGVAVFGALTALNLCPPVAAAAARAFAQGAGPAGALLFAGFFLGTTVYFLPLLGVHLLTRRWDLLPMVGRFALLLLGAYFAVVLGLSRLL